MPCYFIHTYYCQLTRNMAGQHREGIQAWGHFWALRYRLSGSDET
jgi:hypothetical protein